MKQTKQTKQNKYGYCIYLVKYQKTSYIGSVGISNKYLLEESKKYMNSKVPECAKLYNRILQSLKDKNIFNDYYNKIYERYYSYCLENEEEPEEKEDINNYDVLKKYIKIFCSDMKVLQISSKENLEQDLNDWIIKKNTYIYGLNKKPECLKENKDENIKGNYVVYKHTSPKGKIYIGITQQNPPELRWKNGEGYIKNYLFYKDIKEYGWENFTHEILETELTLEQAWDREVYYVDKYDSYYNGYNLTKGGNSYPA